ncbi:MAG: hypothetical protein IKQ05_04910 [Prevotella sp.]|nr:hypothetical protein [Prevotella sp.]
MNEEIHNSAELIELVSRIGFLPLLNSGIRGFSAEEMVDDDCRYVLLPDGGWDWPLWKWKGSIITEGGHVYGKFFAGKAGFISREWWPDFCNYRRSKHPVPAEGSIEETILLTLATHGSLITRELRALCGFDGPKMRSRFDGFVTRLQMATRIVTEDFVYPTDRHGREYGWGWSLLTTPEQLYGRASFSCDRLPNESLVRMFRHLRQLCPHATDTQVLRMLK